jgi:hypothetical protein
MKNAGHIPQPPVLHPMENTMTMHQQLGGMKQANEMVLVAI